eukprot:124570-Hanusia_phi.AAC.5
MVHLLHVPLEVQGRLGLVPQEVGHDPAAELAEEDRGLVAAEAGQHDPGLPVRHGRAERLLERHVHVEQQHQHAACHMQGALRQGIELVGLLVLDTRHDPLDGLPAHLQHRLLVVRVEHMEEGVVCGPLHCRLAR